MFGDPVDNPKGWSIKTLEELGDFKNGLNYRKATGHTVKCLSVRDFKDRREISGVDVLSDISISVKPSREYLLRDGDIVLFARTGIAISQVVVWRFTPMGAKRYLAASVSVLDSPKNS